jgi:chromosome segregation ATPase
MGLTDKTSAIRKRRFASRAETIVTQAIQEHDSRLESLEAESQEDIERLRNSIQEKRSELNALKSDLYEERREHRDRLREKFQEAKESTLDSLESRVADSREALEDDPDEDAWETYVDDLNQAGRNALTDLTERVDELLDEALDVSDLDADWSELQFQFPSPPDVEPDTWFDAADAERLKSQLEDVEEELEDLESQDESASVDGGRRQELIGQLRELKQARRQIADREPPKRRVESSTGQEVGRNIGHIADAALMFVDPTTIASKAASLVGKGASIAKGVVNTDKVSKGLKFLQQSDRTKDIANGLQKASQKIDKFDPDAFRDKAARVAEAAQQQKMGDRLNETGKKLGKLGFLQVLSVSYWTEKIGGMFDSMKDTKLEVDREALEKQREALEQVNEQIRALETELNDLDQQARQDRLSDYERKVKKREKRELEDELAKQQELAEQQRPEIEQEREQLLQERVDQEANRAVQRARKRLIDEIRGVETQLTDTFEQYWEESIEERLEDKQDHLQELHDSLEEVPEERDRHVERINSHLEVLREQQSSIQDTLTR